MAKRLIVVAPPEQVKALKQLAKVRCMSVFSDGKYLKLKWGMSRDVLDQAEITLPEGSFEIYCSVISGNHFRKPSQTLKPDSVRIRIK